MKKKVLTKIITAVVLTTILVGCGTEKKDDGVRNLVVSKKTTEEDSIERNNVDEFFVCDDEEGGCPPDCGYIANKDMNYAICLFNYYLGYIESLGENITEFDGRFGTEVTHQTYMMNMPEFPFQGFTIYKVGKSLMADEIEALSYELEYVTDIDGYSYVIERADYSNWETSGEKKEILAGFNEQMDSVIYNVQIISYQDVCDLYAE